MGGNGITGNEQGNYSAWKQMTSSPKEPRPYAT